MILSLINPDEVLDSTLTYRFTDPMALRVLLADESLNIKKNMQIALQDYGVEVKSLLSGDEVSSIAKIFKPDIIFLDVLLAKINGYDASAHLKNHPDLRHIPVVLIWSSFMDIDEAKFKHSRADGRLEKPFDKQSLRKLVQHFAPKTKSQGLSEFLTLPELRPTGSQTDDSTYSKPLNHFSIKNGALSEHKIEDEPDDFRPGPSPFQSTISEISPLTTQNDEDEEWVQYSARTNAITHEENYEVEIARVHLPPEIHTSNSPELDTLPLMGRPRRQPTTPPKYSGPPPQIQLDQKQLDELVRSELRPILEKAIANALPEIAERVIREHLERLMNETENEL